MEGFLRRNKDEPKANKLFEDDYEEEMFHSNPQNDEENCSSIYFNDILPRSKP